MKLRTIGKGKTEVTMPNGSRLLYIADVLQAGIFGATLIYNFDTRREGDARVAHAVAEWARQYPYTEEGDRPPSQIIAGALMPSVIEFGDYDEGRKSAVKAATRRRLP